MTSSITAGRMCLSFGAVTTSIGCYVADWSKTHVLNPKWPPHAKFHNGQTMSMGLLLGITTLYYTWRPTAAVAQLDSIKTAAIFGSLYWITGVSAIFYPGTMWQDPEFGTDSPQKNLFIASAVLPWVGYILEARRLAGQK